MLALAFAVGAVMVTAWNARESLAAINSLTDARSRTRVVRFELEHLLSLFKDIESGNRGFVITGRQEYLEPYLAALEQVPRSQRLLAQVLADEPGDDVDWAELEALITRRVELARQIIEKRKAGAEIGSVQALLDSGRAIMDRIRENFSRMEAFQDKRLAELNASIQQLRQRTERLSWGSALAALLLVMTAVVLVLREQRIRRSLEQALIANNLSLERRVEQRTIELQDAHDRLAGFAGEQDRAVENERRRLSREVHDQIGQVFTAIKLIANSVPRESYPPGQAEALAQALEMGISSTRRVTAALRPPLLDDLGLGAALNHYIRDLARAGNLAASVDVRDESCLSEVQQLGLFRITQEAVTNVLRHAGASELRIDGARVGADYCFSITDNGRGYDADAVRPGAIGLVGMRERAMLIGATCELRSSPGGAAVELRMPPGAQP